MKQKLSKFGTILKRETLANAPLPFRSRYMVLYSSDPFPGYYCTEEVPADNSCKEFSYYIPFYNNYFGNEELLCRVSMEMKEQYHLNICPAVFKMEGEDVRAFRVKGIETHQYQHVIESLKERDFKLYKHKTLRSFFAHIHLKAFFDIRQLEDGIYMNTDSQGLFYLDIPERLEWEEFEKLITYQKSHSKFRNFDAAIGFWVERPVFRDFIRIYGTELKQEQLQEIHTDFLVNLEKYRKQNIAI